MAEQHPTHPRVLVTFATRGGSTRELAEQVAQVLAPSGLTVDLQPVTAPMDGASSGVVLGSALYFQRLMPEALQFLTNHATILALTRPLVIFSVGAEMRKGAPAARAAAETWVRQSLSSIRNSSQSSWNISLARSNCGVSASCGACLC